MPPAAQRQRGPAAPRLHRRHAGAHHRLQHQPGARPARGQRSRPSLGSRPRRAALGQVCEWCLQLDLDASPFWDYGITGEVLVSLSDDDFKARRSLPAAPHASRAVLRADVPRLAAGARRACWGCRRRRSRACARRWARPLRAPPRRRGRAWAACLRRASSQCASRALPPRHRARSPPPPPQVAPRLRRPRQPRLLLRLLLLPRRRLRQRLPSLRLRRSAK